MFEISIFFTALINKQMDLAVHCLGVLQQEHSTNSFKLPAYVQAVQVQRSATLRTLHLEQRSCPTGLSISQEKHIILFIDAYNVLQKSSFVSSFSVI
jgi:hypothetical protein